MKGQFLSLLNSIDERLPSYFLVRGGRLIPVPLSEAELNKLLSDGYEWLVSTKYEDLDKRVLEEINKIFAKLGDGVAFIFPLAASAIISHEAGRPGSNLNKALYGTNQSEDTTQHAKNKGRKK